MKAVFVPVIGLMLGATKETSPLAWVEVAAESSTVHQGLSWQKVQCKLFETIMTETVPSGAGVAL
jgi:hypothetical protein